jgi:AraC family transcriptional regulator
MNSLAPSATTPRPERGATILALRSRRGKGEVPRPNERDAAATGPPSEMAFPGVDFRPAALTRRRTAVWRGLSGEVVRISKQRAFECHYCGPSHLLIAYQRAARHRGGSTLEDLPRSTLHDLCHKLTFAPAGSRFQEWYDPNGPLQATYLYIDPRGPLMDAAAGFATAQFPPRLFFDNHALWETVLKLAALIEAGPLACRCYAEALSVVLAHELLQLDSGRTPTAPALHGGLASWQRRVVAEYIEENLADQISLARLAEMARLSPYHFSRAFKKSFGMPPRRYHMSRRIDWAKRLLAEPSLSVTDIALQVGFADTSSFSVAFRNLVGQSPREYRRSLP